jgi:hypothetical protein
MNRSRGIRVVLGLLLAAAVVAVAGPAGAEDARTVPLSVVLKVDVNEGPGGACQAGAYFEFTEIKGASSYSITFLDSGKEVTYTLPPFDPAADAGAPAGVHRAGLTGFSASAGGCGNPDAEWRARFQLVSASALVEPLDGKIVGQVTRSSGKPLAGIPVEATRPGGSNRKVFHGVTAKDGSYRITIPKTQLTTYTVSPYRPGFHFDPSFPQVSVGNGAVVTQSFTQKPPKPLLRNAVATVVEIKPVKPDRPTKAEFFRAGRWQPLGLETDLKPGDRVKTDKSTVVVVELDLGGRVAVKPGSEIELLGERAVEDKKAKAFSLTKGGVWAKCGQMKESIEIQTTGGMTGIKG